MTILLLLGLAGTGFIYWDDSVWAPKWIVFSFWAVAWIAAQVTRKFHWSASLPILSVLGSALWVSESRMHQYIHISAIDQVALRELTSRGGMSFLLVVLSVFLMQRRHYIIVEKFLGFFCIINALVVIWEALEPGIRPFHIGGILGNASMNGCAIAFMYPFVVWRESHEKSFPLEGSFSGFIKEFVYIWAPPIAVFCTQSTMAITTLFMTFFAFFWSQYQVRIRTLLIVFGLSVLMGWQLFGADLFNSSGRVLIWKSVIGHFWKNGEIWVGSGTGASQALIPFLQAKLQLNTDGHIFLWLHSDVLQVFFEQGVFGVVAFAVMIFYALKKVTIRQPYIFASLVGWLVTATANYPARMAFHAFVGAFLFAVALRKDENEYKFDDGV